MTTPSSTHYIPVAGLTGDNNSVAIGSSSNNNNSSSTSGNSSIATQNSSNTNSSELCGSGIINNGNLPATTAVPTVVTTVESTMAKLTITNSSKDVGSGTGSSGTTSEDIYVSCVNPTTGAGLGRDYIWGLGLQGRQCRQCWSCFHIKCLPLTVHDMCQRSLPDVYPMMPAIHSTDKSLQQFLPNKICLPCLELLKFFAKFRCKITIAHLLMNSLVELKQHKTSLPLVDLFKTKSDLVNTVIKDLGLCRRNRYGVRDLLKEFPRYDLASFQGFAAQEVKNEKQNDKDNFSDGEKELAPDEVIPKQEIEKDLVEELANYPVESSMIYAEECTVEELNELTKVNPDLLVSDSFNDCPTFKKEKPPAKSKYGGKKLDQPLQCPKCRYSTHYQRNFETHQEVHKKREARVYACKHPGCTEVFNTRSEYKRHGPMAHKAYICDHCGLRSASKSELKNHLARHLHKLEHPCPYCERRHNTKTDLRNHIRYMHLSRVGYQCKICQSSFSRKYIMEEHMATHSNTYAYPCTLCDKKFNVKKYLKSHISTVHERNRLPCRYCSITYDRNYKLNNHIESAHGIQVRFVCDVCVTTYNSQDKLDVHMARHNQPHEMECGRCLTAFTSKNLLDSHPCITYRDDYICCDRDLRYHYIYNKHMLMKHGIKTNVRVKPTPGLLMGQMRAQRKRIETCPKCDQIFATRTLKKQHMEICTFTGDEGQQGGNGGAEAEEAMAVEVLEEMADRFQ